MMVSDTNKQLLAIIVIICAVALFVTLLLVNVPSTVKDPLMIAFGVFIAKFQTVVDYYFGSSEGSKDKTKLLGIK